MANRLDTDKRNNCAAAVNHFQPVNNQFTSSDELNLVIEIPEGSHKDCRPIGKAV